MSCNSSVTTLYALRMIDDDVIDDDDVLLVMVFAGFRNCLC